MNDPSQERNRIVQENREKSDKERAEAAAERARIAQEDRDRSAKERSQSSQERAAEVSAQNAERKQQRESASNVLTSGSANVQLSEIARQGGSLGMKLEREIRRFEQTGRVSNWLAGETIKAEAAQNAAQQGAFREQVMDVISTIGAPISISSDLPSIGFGDKPLLPEEGGGASRRIPWDIYVSDTETDQQGNVTSYTLKVEAGTLARILPPNYEDEFTADNSSLYYGIAKVTTDGTYITGVSIEITTTAPTEQAATEWSLPTSVDILFGLFTKGASRNLVTTGNIDAYGKNVLITTEEAAAIGDPIYKLWFKLQ